MRRTRSRLVIGVPGASDAAWGPAAQPAAAARNSHQPALVQHSYWSSMLAFHASGTCTPGRADVQRPRAIVRSHTTDHYLCLLPHACSLHRRFLSSGGYLALHSHTACTHRAPSMACCRLPAQRAHHAGNTAQQLTCMVSKVTCSRGGCLAAPCSVVRHPTATRSNFNRISTLASCSQNLDVVSYRQWM